MAPTPSTTTEQHGTVRVETPELVVLSYTIAGLGSRAYAAMIDYLLCFLLLILVGVLGTWLLVGRMRASVSEAWALAFIFLGQFAILWFYYLLWEGLADGQTPGKRKMGLRVVRDGGFSVGFGASAVRNLVRFVDMQPFFTYGIGLTSLFVTRQGKRIGDIVAGTIVVREEIVDAVGSTAAAAAGDATGGPPVMSVLTDDEFALLDQFVGRRESLAAERRDQLAGALVSRFERALAVVETETGADAPAETRLLVLHHRERHARASGAITVRAAGAARERHAIVATRSPRWAAFASRLAEAQRRGLRSLGEQGVREFVAEYRDLAADLARMQTATRGASTQPEVFYLSRLMAGAHNLLYRDRSLTVVQVLRYIFVEVPAEILRSWRPIAIAAALLFGPMAIAWTAVARHPANAEMLLPASMLDRAEDGVRRAREPGEGYIDDPQIYRPVMASQIVANNVQVSYVAFASGVMVGIPTVLLLVMNGVSIGSVFGLYDSKGIFELILAFVAPHGVLELFAICVAGAGGLLLAGALLIPGARTRRRALIEEGTRAIRLIAGVTLLLVIAGAIEGLISPIPWWPLEGKLAVSGVTACLLYLYLRGGARSRSGVRVIGER